VARRQASFFLDTTSSLRPGIGEGGKCAEGARFSDLGQLFACAKFRGRFEDGQARITAACTGS